MDPKNGSRGKYRTKQVMPIRKRAQRATNDEGSGYQRSLEQRPPTHDPAHAPQFGFDDGRSRMGMPDDNVRLSDTALSVVGAGGGVGIASSSYSDLTPQMGPTLNIFDHDASPVDLLQRRGVQQLHNPVPNYTDSYDNRINGHVPMNADMSYHLSEYQTPATPCYNPVFSFEDMNVGTVSQQTLIPALASLQNRGGAPWTPYAAGGDAGNSSTPPTLPIGNGPPTLAPHQQPHDRTPMSRRKSTTSNRSMPARVYHSSHQQGFPGPSGSPGYRVPVAEDSRPALRPSSPNLSIRTEDILYCEIGNCDVSFTGFYRRGNRARHWRQKHRQVEEFPCEDPDCNKKYKRQDARLKHYRKQHPRLNPGPALSRKLYAST